MGRHYWKFIIAISIIYSVVKLCIVKGSNNQLYLKARDNMDSTIYLTMFGYLLVSNSIK